jgi:hypothetical protein
MPNEREIVIPVGFSPQTVTMLKAISEHYDVPIAAVLETLIKREGTALGLRSTEQAPIPTPTYLPDHMRRKIERGEMITPEDFFR